MANKISLDLTKGGFEWFAAFNGKPFKTRIF
jgi:hypothetical protein